MQDPISIAAGAWWDTLNTADLLVLRQRLTDFLGAQFGPTLTAELEDIVQHAFLVLFRRRDRVSAEGDGLFRYLKAVAHNAAVDRLRSAKRRRNHHPPAVGTNETYSPGGTVPLNDSLEAVEEHQKIWEVFGALSQVERLIIWSHVVDGQSIRTISKALDLHWHRVDGVVDRFLKHMRRELDR